MSLLQSNSKYSLILINIDLAFEIYLNIDFRIYLKNILDWLSISRIKKIECYLVNNY